MISKTAERMLGAALSMRPRSLIDKFLDWIEELGSAMMPARAEALVRIDERRDPFSA
jgi:hypothetical protein